MAARVHLSRSPLGSQLTGGPGLTAREEQVLGLLEEGVRASAIAAQLGVSVVTVRNHIRAVLRKLGCHSQLEAVAAARRLRTH